MTEASRPRDQVIVCKGQRNFERIWIWFVISFRAGCSGLAVRVVVHGWAFRKSTGERAPAATARLPRECVQGPALRDIS